MPQYKAMMYIHDDPFNPNLCRSVAVRINPFKDMQAAIRAVIKKGEGYIYSTDNKSHIPCWTNLDNETVNRRVA